MVDKNLVLNDFSHKLLNIMAAVLIPAALFVIIYDRVTDPFPFMYGLEGMDFWLVSPYITAFLNGMIIEKLIAAGAPARRERRAKRIAAKYRKYCTHSSVSHLA